MTFIQKIVHRYRGHAVLLSALLCVAFAGAPALAVGGADCQSQGKATSCTTEQSCADAGGTPLGQQDCAASGSTIYICCQAAAQAKQSVSSQPAAPLTPKPGFQNFSLQLPDCTIKGNCGLDDIVLTGVAAANLFMSLSGALFFATFVYGGAMYLLSFGKSDWVSKGTKAMTGAVFGMTIVLSAWTIVNYIAGSLTGKI